MFIINGRGYHGDDCSRSSRLANTCELSATNASAVCVCVFPALTPSHTRTLTNVRVHCTRRTQRSIHAHTNAHAYNIGHMFTDTHAHTVHCALHSESSTHTLTHTHTHTNAHTRTHTLAHTLTHAHTDIRI